MPTIGIYKITNLINGKVYIGQSSNIERRFREHKSNSTSEHLRASIQLYGIDNFDFSILEITDIEDLDDRERYWIQYYSSNDPEHGYNSTDDGESRRGWHHSKYSIQKMSESSKRLAQQPDYVSPTQDTKVIHKGDKTSRCHISQLDEMLADGWELGMSEVSKQKGAENRTGEKNGVYHKGYLFDGDKNPFYGKHHTEATKQKIREHMPDTSHVWKGRHHSESSKQKMRGPRPSVAGVNNPNYGKRGELSSNYGRCAIHKDGVEKRIPKNELDKYLSDGWVKGMNPARLPLMAQMGAISMAKRLSTDEGRKSCASNAGKKLIHKGELTKFISSDELDIYLTDGWCLGNK